MSARVRGYGFTSAVVLGLVVLLVWAGAWAWLHLDRLRKDFSAVQSASFHLAEHVQEKMLALEETLRRMDAHPDAAGLADFRGQAADMMLWVRTNRVSVSSVRQREVLGRMEAAFEAYSSKAQPMLEEKVRNDPGAKPKPVLQEVEGEAAAVLGLGGELRVAEQAALEQFVRASRRSMGSLYTHVVISVGLAAVLALAALRLIHVARIAPLEAKLVESRSVLEQKEKLASLGTLAAGVAHEVRNPLTAIKVRLHSLQRAMAGNLSAKDDLGVIGDEIKRLERIVGDFLLFARPSPPELKLLRVAVLFDQVNRLMGPQVEARGVIWKIEAPPELWVRADPQQVEQVLINLIQNAVENTQRGGSITVRAGASRARWPSGRAPAIVLEVVDTGRGVAPEAAKRLFDPFYSTKPDGTGLGLSIAARIIEKHAGLFEYQSKAGCGTTFRIILPDAAGGKRAT